MSPPPFPLPLHLHGPCCAFHVPVRAHLPLLRMSAVCEKAACSTGYFMSSLIVYAAFSASMFGVVYMLVIPVNVYEYGPGSKSMCGHFKFARREPPPRSLMTRLWSLVSTSSRGRFATCFSITTCGCPLLPRTTYSLPKRWPTQACGFNT
jgi:hypothetical protein